MFPVSREHYWETPLDAIYVGEKKFCCKEGTKNYVILDSGTSFNTMPEGDFSRLLDMIPSKVCSLSFLLLLFLSLSVAALDFLQLFHAVCSSLFPSSSPFFAVTRTVICPLRKVSSVRGQLMQKMW